MAIRQKGTKWQVDVTVRGQRAPRVSCDTKPEAQRVEAEFRSKLLAGVNPAMLAPTAEGVTAPSGTLMELVNATHRSRWANSKGESTAVMNASAWANELGDEFPVADLSPAVVSEVCDEWAKRGNKPSTINRKLAALSMMLKVAEERGMIEKVFRLPRRKEYEGRLRWFSEQEAESLIGCAGYDPMLEAVFIIALETGMRLGEILSLTRKDVDYETGLIMLGSTKGNKRRSIPMTQRARNAMYRLTKRKGVGFGPMVPGYINSRHISRVIAAWKRQQGLPEDDEACFHTFRHTTCSRLVQRGVPINVVMRFMGHTVIETTMRYAHLAPDSLEQAKAALEK